MPRISFLSSNCHHEHPEEKHIFMEVEFEGCHWRIDIGKYGDNPRPSIHISGPIWLEVDHHSVNALDVYLPSAKPKEVKA